MSKYKNRIGEVRYNKHGTKLEIIDYKNNNCSNPNCHTDIGVYTSF